MKTLKNLLMVLSLLLAFNLSAQSEKTFIKTLPTEQSIVSVDLPGDYVTKNWNEDYIKITATVTSNNFSDDFLGKLLSAGRYDFKSSIEDGKQIISMPKLLSKVTIKGVLLEESFSFEIEVPHGYVIQNSKSDNLLK
jgi:hypothetical protein